MPIFNKIFSTSMKDFPKGKSFFLVQIQKGYKQMEWVGKRNK